MCHLGGFCLTSKYFSNCWPIGYLCWEIFWRKIYTSILRKKVHLQNQEIKLVGQEDQEGKVAGTEGPGFCNEATRPVKRHKLPLSLQSLPSNSQWGALVPKKLFICKPFTKPAWLHIFFCFALAWCCLAVWPSWSEIEAPPFPSFKGELEMSFTMGEEGLRVWSRVPIARSGFNFIDIKCGPQTSAAQSTVQIICQEMFPSTPTLYQLCANWSCWSCFSVRGKKYVEPI